MPMKEVRKQESAFAWSVLITKALACLRNIPCLEALQKISVKLVVDVLYVIEQNILLSSEGLSQRSCGNS